MALTFHKVITLPAVLVADAMYFVSASDDKLMEVYLANNAGTAARKVIGELEIAAAIAAYDAQGASKLAAAFKLALGGDATGNVNIDGSGDVELTVTLSDTVVAGSGAVLTFNSKGQVTAARKLTAADLPAEITSDTTGNAATATLAEEAGKTTQALTINGVAFDGSTAVSVDVLDTALVGEANGIASLDAAGKVPAAQLPSYVDDVLEAANFAALPETGESGKIYVAVDTSKVYRWTGSTYIVISDVATLADAADTLATAREIKIAGDATGAVDFDGSADVVITVTGKEVGTAGEQDGIVTTDAQGRVVSSRAIELTDLPSGLSATTIELSSSAW